MRCSLGACLTSDPSWTLIERARASVLQYQTATVMLLSTVAMLSVAVQPAAAHHLTCGQVVTTSVTLDSDVGPCPADGLVAGADFITINLHGFRIFGTPATGDGVGVRIESRTGVVVKGGAISRFDAGVAIIGGSLNRVTKVTAVGNVGDGATAFGDGIVIKGSVDNLVSKNIVLSNGPLSGISVVDAGSSGNQIIKNVVRDNDVADASGNQDDGIRIEPFTTQTTVKGNIVTFNGLDGISLFARSTENFVVGNVVRGNGFHDKAHRKGNGITVFGTLDVVVQNVVEKNVVRGNAGDGIIVRVNAHGNIVQKNTASDNALADPAGFDFRDDNATCDNNTWVKNKGGTFNQACTGP